MPLAKEAARRAAHSLVLALAVASAPAAAISGPDLNIAVYHGSVRDWQTALRPRVEPTAPRTLEGEFNSRSLPPVRDRISRLFGVASDQAGRENRLLPERPTYMWYDTIKGRRYGIVRSCGGCPVGNPLLVRDSMHYKPPVP
ncbi:hypothetical protein [Luteibacter sp.]|jgi:hypothetical protein|uniref:hypothetical protein n=1 Tax=Luteibacter sp. TaxID=1886636 RepID=UPI002F40A95A